MKPLAVPRLLTISLAMVLAGCASPHPSTSTNQSENRPLRAGETITITFGGCEEIPGPPYIIDRDGNIILQFIGKINVAKLTPNEAAKKIHDAYVPHYFIRLTPKVVRKE